MRRPKPGFKNFIKIKIRHPFKGNNKLIFTNDSEDFIDTGSVHTVFIPALIILLYLVTIINVDYTVWGILLYLSALILHRFLRYFWTDFKRLGKAGNEAADRSLPYEVKRPKPNTAKLPAGEKENSGEKVGYIRYKGWQKALIALEALLMFAIVFGSINVTNYPPFARPAFNIADRAITEIDVKDKVQSLKQAYAEVRPLVEKRIPGAELINYGIYIGPQGNETYEFLFRNPDRGIFIHNTVEMLGASLFEGEKVHWEYYSHINLRWMPAKVLSGPAEGFDAEKILGLAFGKAGIRRDDIYYCTIGVWFDIYEAKNDYEPESNIWAVEISGKGAYYRCIVNLEEGTASEVKW